MFNLILFLLFTATVVVIATHAILYYRGAEGTRWQRVLATSRDSATWLWAKVLFVAGLMIEAAANGAEFFNMPDVSKFIQDKVSPSRLGYVLVAIAVMTFVARFRGLLSSRDDK